MKVLVTLCLLACSGLSSCGRAPVEIPAGCEKIVWEDQNWETGGSFHRLTIWADGRCEAVVGVPGFQGRDPSVLRAEPGWKLEKEGRSLRFVRQQPHARDLAKQKFSQALELGIHEVRAHEAEYLDGGGIRIGVQIKGKMHEVTTAWFERKRDPECYDRLHALAELLGDFPRHAYSSR
ncbi:MAG: hypothetical protein ACE5F1_22625 [Planctomycetota bacterium]